MAKIDLYVDVAKALGWTNIRQTGGILAVWASHHAGTNPQESMIVGPTKKIDRIPNYEYDWDAAGPLIERNVHDAMKIHGSWKLCNYGSIDPIESIGRGDSFLTALCHLILDMKKNGQI